MVRVGIIGGGNIGRNHANNINNLDTAELVGLADVAAPVREQFEKDFGKPSFESHSALLELAELDAVIIGLPDRLHCPVALDALGAGKHVLVEKPMAASVEECQQMMDAARAAGRKLMVGQTHHFLPTIRKLREIVANGELGQPVFLRDALIYQHWSPARKGWFFDPNLAGGGAVMANGVHQIDRMRWILDAKEISISASSSHREDIENLEALSGWFVRYDNGCGGQFICGSHTGYKGPHDYEVLFTRGIVRGSSWGELEIFDEAGELRKVDLGERTSHLLEEDRTFIDCITNDLDVPIDGQWGLEVVRVIQAIYESAASGREVIL